MKKIIYILMSLIAILGLTLTVQADSDSLTAQLAGENNDPVVTGCTVDVANKTYDPTESSTTPVTVKFNVTDVNGYGDINDSLAQVEFDDNTADFVSLFDSGATNTSCSSSNVNSSTNEYTCIVNMQYWYQHSENYSIRCSGGDNNDSVLVNLTAANAFDYTQLVASSVDGVTVDFGTLTTSDYNTNVSDSNSPLNITNTGNTVLSTVSITGANLTQTGKSDIDIGQFYADDDNGVAGAQQLTTSKQQITGVSVPLEDATAGGNTDSAWVWFNVPSYLDPGTFSASWTLWEEE
jgi:hypothetical protein